ncbi:MAG TPA: GYF domain-containing protein [Candidatus Limnocylindrales bacterium]|jgi:hypothetical protein|nr:GYF domain-containing protein [Candidatus Limnocylindrales bacterium]
MNWYYVDSGQQAGPVEEAQLLELVRSGKIQPDTLVWHEGMTAWTPYQEVAPRGSSPEEPASGTVPPVAGSVGTGGLICCECGRAFAVSDVIRYNDKWICAACKPIFFQRLREGAAVGSGVAGAPVTEADLLARDYEVDIGSCLSRGWEVFKSNAGLIIGATVLVYLAIFAVNAVPYLSIILALFLNGPLMGGLWNFYVKEVRSGSATLGDAFSGFGPRFWQLLLTQLIPGLISGAIIGVLAALVIPAVIFGGRQAAHAGSFPTQPGFWIPIGIGMLLALIIMTYLNTCWMFALPLAADKGLKFWPALELSRRIVSKHWWMTFWLLVVAGVIALLGLLACGVGLIVTCPIAFAMLACHYEKVFGDLTPSPT